MTGVPRSKLLPPEERKGDSHYIPVKLRRKVIAKFGGICQVCGDKGVCVSHRVPVARGGGDDFYNFTLLCYRCARAKGSMTLEEFMRSAYFLFEVLNVLWQQRPKPFKVRLYLHGGRVIKGEMSDDPASVQGENYCIYNSKSGWKLIVPKREIQFTEVLKRRPKRPKLVKRSILEIAHLPSAEDSSGVATPEISS